MKTNMRWITQVAVIAFCFSAFIFTTALIGPGRGADEVLLSDEPYDESIAATENPAPGSVTAEIAHLKKIDSECPPPTVKDKGGNCVLVEDVVLTETLNLDSFTTLNCKGHKLVASSPGTTSGTGLITSASVPEVAILINKAVGVKIQNCVIEGTDFGVVVLNSKTPSGVKDDHGTVALYRNKILSNTLRPRVQGVMVLESDNTQISDNTIAWTSGGGMGVNVFADSDLNIITNNILNAPAAAGLNLTQLVPGRLTPRNPSESVGVQISSAMMSTLTAFGIRPTVINFIVGGELTQIPFMTDAIPEDNLVEGNTVTYPATTVTALPGQRAGFFSSGSRNTIIRNNNVQGGSHGAFIHGTFDLVTMLPGACSGDATRACGSDADCFISGVDSFSKGTCSDPAPTSITLNVNSDNVLVEGNNFVGPRNNGRFSAAGVRLAGASNTRVERNSIVNGQIATSVGIAMVGQALESSTITRNIISGNAFGLQATRITGSGWRVFGRFFGSEVYLNDITGSSVSAFEAVGTGTFVNVIPVPDDGTYNLFTELSVNGKGNYWGRACPGFDTTADVTSGCIPAHTTAPDNFHKCSINPTRSCTGAITAVLNIPCPGDAQTIVQDSHPYGQPVAATPDAELPSTCQ